MAARSLAPARPPRASLALALALALAASSARPAASAGDDSFLFLDNGRVRVGVDVTRGGSIGWLSASGGRNLVNHADMGREVQLRRVGGQRVSARVRRARVRRARVRAPERALA